MIEIKRKIFLSIFKIFVYLRFTYLTAILIFLSLRKIKGINYVKTNKIFLVLGKSIGLDDLKISYQNINSNIIFYNLDRNVTKIIFRSFVKKKIYKDYDYNSKDRNVEHQLKKLKIFLYDIFTILKKFKNFQGIINFNVFYYGDVELQKISKKLGVKFFSIHKEALKPPLYLKYFKWIYKNTANKFYGTKILTYNDFEKKLMVDGKVAPKNKIKVIGMPRLIKSFDLVKDHDNSKNKKIILYSSLFRKLPYFKNPYYKKPKHKIFENKSDLNFNEIQEKTLILLSKFLDKNQNARVTLKVRVGHEKLFEKKSIHKRMDVVKGGSGHDLLKNHDIVFAFNSTIILEALAAKKIVFCPFQNIKSGELFKFINLTISSNSERFILKKLQNIYDNKNNINFTNQKAVSKVLNLYLRNNDKMAGKRLIKVINT